MKFKGLDSWKVTLDTYEVFFNGKVVGRLTNWDKDTSTITYKRYSWLRKRLGILWIWVKVAYSRMCEYLNNNPNE